MRRIWSAAHVTLCIGAASICAGQPVEVRTRTLSVRLDAEAGYAVTGLIHQATGTDFLGGEGEAGERSPWTVLLRTGVGETPSLTSADAKSASHEVTADGVRVTWRGVGSDECPADLTVTADIRAPGDGGKAYWRIAVEGRAPGVLWQVDFPRIVGVTAGAESRMSLPWYWGRLWRDPEKHPAKYVLSYPQPASMQWHAYWATPDVREPMLPSEEGRLSESGWSPDRSDAAGLYWAAEDGELYYKRFAVDTKLAPGAVSWWVENLPELDTWPVADGVRDVEYRMPYEVAIGAFTGDYHEAAELYLDWARDQEWCARGTADTWPREAPEAGSDELARWVPPWFREVAFWAKFYHEPAKVLPEWAAYRKWLRVPMASHYYRYNVSTFDDNYPEHLPPDPYLLSGVRDAKDLGVRPLPYINGVIWDTDTQSWIRENGLAAALKNEEGGIYPWDIHGNIYAYMDPSAEQWQAKMREAAGKLILEHGVSGVYLDCLTATRSMPSYDPSHPHACHGGPWHGQGNRKLMRDLRLHVRERDPQACFFTEEIGEVVIDVMDGYLTLDQWRSYCPAGLQVHPMFTAVYHPYTINFGCDAMLGQDPDVFAWEMGQMLIWGAQPLNSAVVAPLPREGDPDSEFLREVVDAYHTRGSRYLQGGKWRRIAVRPQGSLGTDCGLDLVTAAHTVAYDQRKDRRRLWHGPAVMASAWERDGDIGVVLVNITGEEQKATLTVRPDVLDLPEGTKLVRGWPLPWAEPVAAAGEHQLTLPPRTVALYIVTDNVGRAREARELEPTPWELVHVEEDGPLPQVHGPAGSLWACSDGPVVNSLTRGGTVATACSTSISGTLMRRQGRQAERRGSQAEGHGLPRDLQKKPFALLRKLPVEVVGEGEVVVLAGGDDWMLCRVPGGVRLELAAPGIIVATDARTGEMARGLTEPQSGGIDVPRPRRSEWLVGYVAAREGSHREAHEALRAVIDGPAEEREEALSEATAAIDAAIRSAEPGDLTPESPLMQALDRTQALARAYVGGGGELIAKHRWLTPGAAKLVGFRIRVARAATVVPGSARLSAVGAPCEVAPQADAGALRLGSDVYASVVLGDAGHVERLVPVVGSVTVERDGKPVVLTDVLHLEANRPFEIRKPASALTVVVGRTGKTSVTLRNWSPDPVTATVRIDAPEGWEASPEAGEVELSELSDQRVELAFAPPVTAQRGSYTARCHANHLDDPAAQVTALVRIALLPSLAPLQPAADPSPVPEDNRARLRRSAKLVLYAQEGERLRVSVHNYRAGNYTATGSFALRSPDLEVLAEGSIPLAESGEVDTIAPLTGTYYLDVKPGVGQAEVVSENGFFAELATGSDPLNLFCSPVTRHFYVPPGSEGFLLCAQDGGPTETARLVVTAPGGRVALDRDGNYSGTRMPVDVLPEEAGRVWTLRVVPVQDVSVWFEGDVCPYLAASEEAVLAER